MISKIEVAVAPPLQGGSHVTGQDVIGAVRVTADADARVRSVDARFLASSHAHWDDEDGLDSIGVGRWGGDAEHAASEWPVLAGAYRTDTVFGAGGEASFDLDGALDGRGRGLPSGRVSVPALGAALGDPAEPRHLAVRVLNDNSHRPVKGAFKGDELIGEAAVDVAALLAAWPKPLDLNLNGGGTVSVGGCWAESTGLPAPVLRLAVHFARGLPKAGLVHENDVYVQAYWLPSPPEAGAPLPQPAKERALPRGTHELPLLFTLPNGGPPSMEISAEQVAAARKSAHYKTVSVPSQCCVMYKVSAAAATPHGPLPVVGAMVAKRPPAAKPVNLAVTLPRASKADAGHAVPPPPDVTASKLSKGGGGVAVRAALDKAAYRPGEPAQLGLSAKNTASTDATIKVVLVQKVLARGTGINTAVDGHWEIPIATVHTERVAAKTGYAERGLGTANKPVVFTFPEAAQTWPPLAGGPAGEAQSLGNVTWEYELRACVDAPHERFVDGQSGGGHGDPPAAGLPVAVL